MTIKRFPACRQPRKHTNSPVTGGKENKKKQSKKGEKKNKEILLAKRLLLRRECANKHKFRGEKEENVRLEIYVIKRKPSHIKPEQVKEQIRSYSISINLRALKGKRIVISSFIKKKQTKRGKYREITL